jgi:hypothetical protein
MPERYFPQTRCDTLSRKKKFFHGELSDLMEWLIFTFHQSQSIKVPFDSHESEMFFISHFNCYNSNVYFTLGCSLWASSGPSFSVKYELGKERLFL